MTVEPILRVSGLTKKYGKVIALRNVSFDLAPGEVLSVIGSSGCGKSTLLKCLNYLEEPSFGLVEVRGRHIGRIPRPDGSLRRQSARELNAIRPAIGIVFQSLNLWSHLSAVENIAKGPIKVRRIPAEQARQRARALLERFGLAAKADSLPSDLSGGEKQRVAICRALAMDPELMLFDEPTSALDPELVNEVVTVLRELANQGMAMIVVTHEIGVARQLSDRVVFMDRGEIHAQGTPAEIFGAPTSARLKDFLSNRHPFGGA